MKSILSLALTLVLASAGLAAPYQWIELHSNAGKEYALYEGQVQLGCYRTWDDQYWPLVNPVLRLWGPPCKPPYPLPDKLRSNFGMGWTPKAKDENVLHFGGGKQPDIKKTIKRTSDASDVPDYNSKWSITVVTRDESKRKEILNALTTEPVLARWKEERLKGYDPDDWALAPFKLEQDDEFRKSGLVVIAQPPPDQNLKSPVSAIYGYSGPQDLANRLREVEARYDPNVHADAHSASPEWWKVAAIAVLATAILLTVLFTLIHVGVIKWQSRSGSAS